MILGSSGATASEQRPVGRVVAQDGRCSLVGLSAKPHFPCREQRTPGGISVFFYEFPSQFPRRTGFAVLDGTLVRLTFEPVPEEYVLAYFDSLRPVAKDALLLAGFTSPSHADPATGVDTPGMRPRHHRAILIAATTTAVAALGRRPRSPPPARAGPRTTVNPYVVPVADGVSTKSLLTVGDQARRQRLPDGRHPRRPRRRPRPTTATSTLIMNHELRRRPGRHRACTARRAPSSRELTIDRGTLDGRRAGRT